MNNKQIDGLITALYERLSRDDEQLGDSNSIVNQKKMLETYCEQNGYTNIVHYTDDGYSGGSFDRPDWKRLIEDIEAGKVGMVITKDMSRIGRNYLEVGYYTEIYFGQKNIRFIAIANGVDSENQGSSEFAPFLNVMNEWYLRDCSRKIRATKQVIGNSGKHISSHAPYGYKKDPEDKHHWLVDEEAAEVVRRIYRLCIEGKGIQMIAKQLQADKIETPGYYQAKRSNGVYKNRLDVLDPYKWSGTMVKHILTKPDYLGYTVNFRTTSKSYKDKKSIQNPPEKWAVFEGTQEPIIDLETWQLCQKLLGTPRRCDTIEESNPFTGLVYCADCGEKMYNQRSRPFTDSIGTKHSGTDAYNCST
ncbi:MAG: recombinase family protein, partial [Bacteroidaceae bacterium]|nr:recombinase family protein [Bacteroidaceae bacterium]